MGNGKRGDPLHTLVPATDGGHGREARRLHGARRKGWHGGKLQREAARAAGTGRKLVPQRRNKKHVRGARILSMGPHFAGIHHRRHTMYTHGIHIIYRRGARLQGAVAQGAARGQYGGDRCLQVFRPRGERRSQQPGMGTGVLSRRRGTVLGTPRPDAYRQDADGPRKR